MDELEITQSNEDLESVETVEATEAAEEQALQDATHEPGARIEETQNFEQAEAIETALTEAVESADMGSVGELPVPLPQPALEDEGGGQVAGATQPGDNPPPPDTSEKTTHSQDVGYEEAPPGGGPPSVEGLPIPVFNEAQEVDSSDEDVSGLPIPLLNTTQGVDSPDEDVSDLPIPLFNTALEDEGVGNVGQESEPGGTPPTPDASINLSPGFDGNIAQEPDPLPDPGGDNVAIEDDGEGGRQHFEQSPELGTYSSPIPAETNDPPDPKGPNLEAGLTPGFDGNLVQEPDPLPDPGDGSVAADEGGGQVAGATQPGDRPPPPDNNVGLSPGVDGNVAEIPDEPGPPGPNIGLSPDDVKKGGAQIALTPDDVKQDTGINGNVSETPDEPGPPGPNKKGQENL